MTGAEGASPAASVSEQVGVVLAAQLQGVQTVAKRRMIARAACELFIAQGYPATSVDEIAARAGVAKQTVYKHFGSKESLFLAVTTAATDAVTDELAASLEAGIGEPEDVERELVSFARTLARLVLRPEMMALRRLVMTEVARFPELGRTWYAHGPGRVVEQLSRRFRRLAERGCLSVDDPERAAERFNWLVLAGPQSKILFGVVDGFTDAEIDEMAAGAVRFFLAAHGPRSNGTPPAENPH